jgi:hypothetical protein
MLQPTGGIYVKKKSSKKGSVVQPFFVAKIYVMNYNSEVVDDQHIKPVIKRKQSFELLMSQFSCCNKYVV